MIYRVYRNERRGISHAVRAGREYTLCGIPCGGWAIDRTKNATKDVACKRCLEVPIERGHVSAYRTKDGAYDIAFDDNIEAWRDMSTQTFARGKLPSRFRGVWLVYDAPDGEPIWFHERRAFLRLTSAHSAIRLATLTEMGLR